MRLSSCKFSIMEFIINNYAALSLGAAVLVFIFAWISYSKITKEQLELETKIAEAVGDAVDAEEAIVEETTSSIFGDYNSSSAKFYAILAMIFSALIAITAGFVLVKK